LSSVLFAPIELRGLTLSNRIVVSPMCQYSAVDGCATDWHLMHLGQFAVSGAGLLIVEMTNVEARGRISPRCMGLYSDDNERAIKRVVDFCKAYGNTPVAVQLAHAGRKASTRPPWEGREPIGEWEGGWRPVAPSAVASGEDELPPLELTREEIHVLVSEFEAATKRAIRAGFEAIELHAAHGYLLHQFLSPLSNLRDDEYGGDANRRMRFPLEVVAAVRAAWPDDKPLGVRVSATDWVEGGWSLEDTVRFAHELKSLGCDWIDVSSGGLVKDQQITTGPGYQVPFSERVRSETGMTTIAVGMITEPEQAEAIVAGGKADMVALARGMLYDPRWTWHAAEALDGNVRYPNQYLRCRPWVSNDPLAAGVSVSSNPR
jgi:2,4-dienoyl-CoA reductase-like NADH-dependent reductase (Old Yellow Enzyme family)